MSSKRYKSQSDRRQDAGKYTWKASKANRISRRPNEPRSRVRCVDPQLLSGVISDGRVGASGFQERNGDETDGATRLRNVRATVREVVSLVSDSEAEAELILKIIDRVVTLRSIAAKAGVAPSTISRRLTPRLLAIANLLALRFPGAEIAADFIARIYDRKASRGDT